MVLQDRVCYTAHYMGYVPGTAGQGDVQVEKAKLEALTGRTYNVGYYAGGNSITGYDNTMKALDGFQGHIVLGLPLCPDPSGTLADTIAGTNDSLFLAVWNAILAWVARGGDMHNLTIRLGWESTLGNFAWSVHKNGQTSQNYIDAWVHVVLHARAHGITVTSGVTWEFNGGGVGYDAIGSNYPGDAYVDIVGHDRYNNRQFSTQTEAQSWAVIQPMLDGIYSFVVGRDSARAAAGLAPLLMGFSECGIIVQSANAYRLPDSSTWWPRMTSWILSRIDRMRYMIQFNQNGPSTGTLTTSDENSQYLYWNRTGSTNMSYQNGTSPVPGTWTYEPSGGVHAASMATFKTAFGSDIVGPPLVTPPPTFNHRIENFPSSATLLGSLWSGTVGPVSNPWFVVPGSPGSLAATRSVDGKTIVITWQAPTFIGSSALTGFKASRNGTDASGNGAYASPLQPTSTLSWSFLNLDPTQTYTLSVVAENAAGDSLPASVVVGTAPPPAGPVTDPRVTVLSPTAVQVDWTAIPNATSYLVKVSVGNQLVSSGDLFDNTFSDVWLSTAVPTGISHGVGGSVTDSFSDTFRDVWGTPPNTITPPILPPAVTLTVTGNTATVSGLTGATDYIVTIKAQSQFASAAASPALAFRTLDPNASDPIVIPPAPVIQRPQPTGEAFPRGASYRPVNFGAEVANNA
jgi:hypothetical protein